MAISLEERISMWLQASLPYSTTHKSRMTLKDHGNKMKSPNTKAFQEIIGYDISKDDLIPQENKTVIYG